MIASNIFSKFGTNLDCCAPRRHPASSAETSASRSTATGSAGQAVAGQWPSSAALTSASADWKSVPAQPHGPGSTVAATPGGTGGEAAATVWRSPPGISERGAPATVGLRAVAGAFTSAQETDGREKEAVEPSHEAQSQQPRRSIVAGLSWQASQIERVCRCVLMPRPVSLPRYVRSYVSMRDIARREIEYLRSRSDCGCGSFENCQTVPYSRSDNATQLATSLCGGNNNHDCRSYRKFYRAGNLRGRNRANPHPQGRDALYLLGLADGAGGRFAKNRHGPNGNAHGWGSSLAADHHGGIGEAQQPPRHPPVGYEHGSLSGLRRSFEKPRVVPRQTARNCSGADAGHLIHVRVEFAVFPFGNGALGHFGDSRDLGLRQVEYGFANVSECVHA